MTNGNTNTTTMPGCRSATETMREDVLRGLARDPKMLPSQYLYDQRGARLFEHICETDEYYLTRTEISILRRNMPAIVDCIGPGALIIEPGSGSGVKTRLLLKNLEDPAAYVPIDLAREQLAGFSKTIGREFPELEVKPLCADFTDDYEVPACDHPVHARVCYFPGSTIGNFEPAVAVDMLQHFAALCNEDGGLLIGVDLKKDRCTLESAYDDAQGVSRAFALNYLVRLNRELGAGFRLEQFGYQAPYNESVGRIEMALVSLCDQVVDIDGSTVWFKNDERVCTEYSYKYTRAEFAALAERADLRVERIWTDAEELFSVQYLVPR
jgi:dimethylhistidine N-methyltransferase